MQHLNIADPLLMPNPSLCGGFGVPSRVLKQKDCPAKSPAVPTLPGLHTLADGRMMYIPSMPDAEEVAVAQPRQHTPDVEEPIQIARASGRVVLTVVNSLADLLDGDGKFLAGTVNVTGNVSLNGQKLERLPVRFGTIGGSFSCNYNRLTSLEGAPSTVGGYFNCSDNWLTSLEGAPGSVGRDFYCTRNRLTQLGTLDVGGDFHCGGNQLTVLAARPTVAGRSYF